MSRSPPLRFLILLLAGWSGMRAALLTSGWWAPPAEAGIPPPTARAMSRAKAAADVAKSPGRRAFAARSERGTAIAAHRRSAREPPERLPDSASSATLAWKLAPRTQIDHRPMIPVRPVPAESPLAASRWSFAAWSFLREGDPAPLAAGGMLGGSQAGARLAYRLNEDRARPLALSARLSAPIRRPAGAEAALGLDWQPSRRLPIHLLAERRQRLGRDGRSAFGLTAYGGISDSRLGRLRVDAYAQAGLVGARSRDLFADGAARLSLPLGSRASVGGGLWAAAQTGVARIDAGPQALLRLPLDGRNVTLLADWRQRIAGNALPDSGPTLTVATEF
jgi:hypothetical protein